MSRQVIGEEGIRRWSAWSDLALLTCLVSLRRWGVNGGLWIVDGWMVMMMMMLMLMDGWMDKWAVDEIEGFVIGRCRQVSFPLYLLSVWMKCMEEGGRELDGGLA